MAPGKKLDGCSNGPLFENMYLQLFAASTYIVTGPWWWWHGGRLGSQHSEFESFSLDSEELDDNSCLGDVYGSYKNSTEHRFHWVRAGLGLGASTDKHRQKSERFLKLCWNSLSHFVSNLCSSGISFSTVVRVDTAKSYLPLATALQPSAFLSLEFHFVIVCDKIPLLFSN